MNKVANSLNLPLIVDRNVSINGVSTFIAVEDNKNVAVDMDSD